MRIAITIISLLISLGGVLYVGNDYIDTKTERAAAIESALKWKTTAEKLVEEKARWDIILSERSKENARLSSNLAEAKDKLNELSIESKQYLALPIPNDLIKQLQDQRSKATQLP